MQLHKDTPFEAGFAHVPRGPGEDLMTVVVKATFALGDDAPCTPSDAQRPLSGDVYADDDPTRELLYASDLAAYKPVAEVFALGHCHVTGPAVERTVAALRVGPVSAAVSVTGDRHWTSYGSLSSPVPFTSMPLLWSRAFGGPSHPTNPAGVGLDAREGVTALPNLEAHGALIATPDDRPPPASLGPRSPQWAGRREHLGTYDLAWRLTRWPAFAADLSWEHFLAAPRAQRASSFFQGDERVELRNLVPGRATVSTSLPALRPRVLVEGDEGLREVAMQLDTVIVHGDEGELVCLWRGLVRVRNGRFAGVDTLYVTHDPLGAPRSLDALVEALRAKVAAEAAKVAAPPPPPPPAEEPAEEAPEAPPAPPVDEDGRPFTPPETAPLPSLDEARKQFEALNIEVPAALLALLAEAHEPDAPVAMPEPDEDPREVLLRALAAGEDLQGRDFTGVDLSYRELGAMKFAGAILANARFLGAVLDGCDFTGCVLTGAVFDDADLHGAVFERADLEGASARRVDAAKAVLTKAVARGSTWTGSRFDGATFTQADFSRARLDRCRFADGVMGRVDLAGAVLRGSVFTRAVLAEATLERCDGEGVDLTHCDLTALRAGDGAQLRGLRATDVKAPGAVFDASVLEGADFSRAEMDGASFSGAALAGARFEVAKLRKARFDGAVMTGATLLGSDGMHADFEGTDLRDADLRGVNLYQANLREAQTRGARWELANLAGTLREGAR